MKNNYDRTAGFYDMLSKLVFGNALMQAQQSTLEYIPKNAQILIVGGGTGKILEYIANIHSSGLSITYVEISNKMLEIAKRRNAGENTVVFENNAIEDFQSTQHFDVIITAFLFDNFEQNSANAVFDIINERLVSGGKWLFTDFHIEPNQKWSWHNALLKSMYLFFKLFANIEASSLPDTAGLFQNAGYQILFNKFFFSKFIQSLVYQKP